MKTEFMVFGPENIFQSNLIKDVNEEELDDSIKAPNLSLVTPVHQSKISRFSISRSRIFGDSKSEPQEPCYLKAAIN